MLRTVGCKLWRKENRKKVSRNKRICLLILAEVRFSRILRESGYYDVVGRQPCE